MRTRIAVVLLAGAVILAACGGALPVPDGAGLRVANATSVPVAVHLNDEWVGTYPAWSDIGPIPLHGRDRPLRVELRLADGTVASSLRIDTPEGPPSGTSSRWVSSCGTLVAWVGERPGDAPSIDPAAARPAGPPCD